MRITLLKIIFILSFISISEMPYSQNMSTKSDNLIAIEILR